MLMKQSVFRGFWVNATWEGLHHFWRRIRVSGDCTLLLLPGPIPLTVFPRTTHLIIISFGHSHVFIWWSQKCTWHNSNAAVVCETFCCNLMASDCIRTMWIFHQVWFANNYWSCNAPLVWLKSVWPTDPIWPGITGSLSGNRFLPDGIKPLP